MIEQKERDSYSNQETYLYKQLQAKASDGEIKILTYDDGSSTQIRSMTTTTATVMDLDGWI